MIENGNIVNVHYVENLQMEMYLILQKEENLFNLN
jgi:hypothetical protein